MSQQATELIAKQMAAGASIGRIWGTLIFNVKDSAYGAKGDGLNDDTAAINSAIPAAQAVNGIVYFPPGTYKVTAPINISGNGFVTLAGSGGHTQASIITATFAGDIFNVTALYLVCFKDLRIKHGGSSGRCFTLNLGEQHRIENCSIENVVGNTSDMINFAGSNTTIRSNTFNNNEAASFAIRCRAGTTKMNINSRVEDNYFGGIGKGVIVSADGATYRPEGLKISRNDMILTGAEHVSVHSCLHIDIDDNIFDQSSLYGIQVYSELGGVEGVYITNNYIATAANTANGIAVYCPAVAGSNTKTIDISDNLITQSGYGIVIESRASKAIVKGNEFDNIAQTAITVNQSLNVTVQDNIIDIISTAYSLSLQDGASGGKFIIKDNILTGLRLTTITTRANWIIRDNIGWKSDNVYTGNFVADVIGVKTLNITHDLASTPDINKISLSVTASTADFEYGSLMVTAVTATIITVSVKVTVAGAAGRVGAVIAAAQI